MFVSHCIQIYQKALKYSNNEAAAYALTFEVEAFINDTLADKKSALAIEENERHIHNEIINLHIKIAEAKVDTIKWMFIFWIGQIGATLAIILLFLKK